MLGGGKFQRHTGSQKAEILASVYCEQRHHVRIEEAEGGGLAGDLEATV